MAGAGPGVSGADRWGDGVSTVRDAAGEGPLVSVVFPVFDEADNLRPLYAQVTAALEGAGVEHELVFVDNGSSDSSLAIIKEIAAADDRVRFVSLSRNFGHQGGLLAGMVYSKGDAVITMDADLQQPPSLLPDMVELWKDGNSVVYTKKKNYTMPAWRTFQVRMFYRLVSKLSGLELSFGQSDFRLLDRQVADLIIGLPEYRKFLRGIVQWVGLRQAGLEYEVAARHAGESKFRFATLVSFAIDGILSFSLIPLRASLLIGFVVAAICIAFGLYTVTIGALNLFGAGVPLPPGWATLTASALFLASVQLLAIGALSEYVGRIFEQTKGRPPFIVQELSGGMERR